MKISINWLKSYIDFDLAPQDIAQKLTMVGLEVEEIIPVRPLFRNVVIGDVLTVEKHPNADKLSVCVVDVGNEKLPVVCGAPNVKPGIRVPVVKIGGHVGEMKIKKVSLRGVESCGMICSERELGLSEEHSGILILDDHGQPLGDPFLKEMQVADTVLEIDVTPNRPDCLSHLGVARELGAILGKPIHMPDAEVNASSASKTGDLVDIKLDDPAACPRYTVRIIQDAVITESPGWLRARLESVGIRSINNIVDVTNFILMETGHPLHAFDYDKIEMHRIHVRHARKNERFVTLDDIERSLQENDLLICDGKRPVALAGIMGGQNSEITDSTTNILLESAYFDPMTIRKSARRLGMSTEASQRFERGADPNGTVFAVNRAVKLMVELSGGKLVQSMADVYPEPVKAKTIQIREERVKRVLGVPVPKKEILSIFKLLDFKIEKSDHIIEVTVPTSRPDLQKEVDLIEEIVRHYGYEHIPANLTNTLDLGITQNDELCETERIRDVLSGLGFSEVWNSSFVSELHIKSFTPDIKPVEIKNPLSPDTQFLRTCVIPSILDNLKWNINRGEKNLRLFEIGRVFHPGKNQCPDEKWIITAAVTGNTLLKPTWQTKPHASDFFHMKGIVETFLNRLHIANLNLTPFSDPVFGETALNIFSEKHRLGNVGKLNETFTELWDIQQDVFTFRIDLQVLMQCLPKNRKYHEIPRFPSVKRDLAMVVEKTVQAGSMIDEIRSAGGKLVSAVDVFDIYNGKPLTENQKSVAFALTFMSKDRTLREDEINPLINKIIKRLEQKFHAVLRT